ncbi:MAG: hypothetical protein AMJ94_06465 [Deltaproteobacteria bacterium SM23_61]|nr:MAG: hypothetical protein AMJ94_06465 [Deltaproteobacteria bacterium SM23_61]
MPSLHWQAYRILFKKHAGRRSIRGFRIFNSNLVGLRNSAGAGGILSLQMRPIFLDGNPF